jgi:Tfp pilus assembly protein PilZ
MAGPGGLERRRAERVPMPARRGSIAVVGARLVNASPFGMMIESPVAMARDALLEVRLIVMGENVDVRARVAACTAMARGARTVFGIGLEFTRIPDHVRERIRQVLTVRAPARTA